MITAAPFASPELVDKNARRALGADPAQLCAKDRRPDDLPHGAIEGYAAVWDVVDLQDEIIRRGAFAKSLRERVPAGKVKLMVRHFAHGGDVPEVIGTITEMKEDATGLFFRARLAGVPPAQQARQLVLEGHVDGCSIGFLPVRWRWTDVDGRRVLEHLECKAVEVTLTVRPANEQARITGAKAGPRRDRAAERPSHATDALTLDLAIRRRRLRHLHINDAAGA